MWDIYIICSSWSSSKVTVCGSPHVCRHTWVQIVQAQHQGMVRTASYLRNFQGRFVSVEVEVRGGLLMLVRREVQSLFRPVLRGLERKLLRPTRLARRRSQQCTATYVDTVTIAICCSVFVPLAYT